MPFLLKDPLVSEKCFKLTPPKIPNINELESISKDWLEKLEEICQIKGNLLNSKHIEYANSKEYSLRFESSDISLNQALKFIYHQLSRLDPKSDDHKAIILRMTSNVEACTEGFINCVSEILSSFQRPRNLDELLYQSRFSLVKNVTSVLVSNIQSEVGQQIHAVTQVQNVAAAKNLGIEVNFVDKCLTKLSDNTIIGSLEKEFEEEYTAFNLPFLLADQLRGVLASIGYTGPNERDGYTTGIAEKLADTIQCYLSKEIVDSIEDKPKWKSFFIIDEDDEFNITIRDLDWKLIRKHFLSTLVQENYLTESPSKKNIHNLLDYAYFSEFFPEDNTLSRFEDKYIVPDFFHGEDYLQLEKIKTNCPVFWEKLRSHPNLIELFISALEKTSFNKSKHAAKVVNLLFTLDWISLIDDNSTIFDSFIKKITKYTGTMNQLMFAVQCQQEMLEPLLKFITKNPTHFNQDTTEKMFFLETDTQGWNVLFLTAARQPRALKYLLEFISKNYPSLLDDNKAIIQEVFFGRKTDNYQDNLLLSTVYYQPEILNYLLKFISENPSLLLDNEAIRRVFSGSNTNGWNPVKLLLAASAEAASADRSEALTYLLKFISENPKLFNQKTIEQIFKRETFLQSINTKIRHIHKWNPLMLAARYEPKALKQLLQFISKNQKLFPEKIIEQIFLETDYYGNNLLLLAARYQPEALTCLLKFISENPKLFDQKILQKMFMGKTYLQCSKEILIATEMNLSYVGYGDPLTVALRYHSETKSVINQFIICSELTLNKNTMTVFLEGNKTQDAALKLLEKYLDELLMREESNVTHTTRFFKRNFGYSTQEKKATVLALKFAIKNPDSINLLDLQKQHPALQNSRLGLITDTFLKLKSDKSLDTRNNSQMNPVPHH